MKKIVKKKRILLYAILFCFLAYMLSPHITHANLTLQQENSESVTTTNEVEDEENTEKPEEKTTAESDEITAESANEENIETPSENSIEVSTEESTTNGNEMTTAKTDLLRNVANFSKDNIRFYHEDGKSTYSFYSGMPAIFKFSFTTNGSISGTLSVNLPAANGSTAYRFNYTENSTKVTFNGEEIASSTTLPHGNQSTTLDTKINVPGSGTVDVELHGIIVAKRLGVIHQVPIICTFGGATTDNGSPWYLTIYSDSKTTVAAVDDKNSLQVVASTKASGVSTMTLSGTYVIESNDETYETVDFNEVVTVNSDGEFVYDLPENTHLLAGSTVTAKSPYSGPASTTVKDVTPPSIQLVESPIYTWKDNVPDKSVFIEKISDAHIKGDSQTLTTTMDFDAQTPGWNDVTITATDEAKNTATATARAYVYDAQSGLTAEDSNEQLVNFYGYSEEEQIELLKETLRLKAWYLDNAGTNAGNLNDQVNVTVTDPSGDQMSSIDFKKAGTYNVTFSLDSFTKEVQLTLIDGSTTIEVPTILSEIETKLSPYNRTEYLSDELLLHINDEHLSSGWVLEVKLDSFYHENQKIEALTWDTSSSQLWSVYNGEEWEHSESSNIYTLKGDGSYSYSLGEMGIFIETAKALKEIEAGVQYKSTVSWNISEEDDIRELSVATPVKKADNQ